MALCRRQNIHDASVLHFVYPGSVGFALAGIAARARPAVRFIAFEVIGCVLEVEPDDGVVRAMLLRLLLGAKRHQHRG